MTAPKEVAKQLASALMSVLHETSEEAVAAGSIIAKLDGVIDALPYYGDPDWDKAHRGMLINVLELSLPNSPVKPHPDENGIWDQAYYTYEGPYSGYRDAFFHDVVQSAAASKVQSMVSSIDWAGYSAVVLTDAIRRRVSISLNTSALARAISSYNTKLQPSLSATFLVAFETAYGPTSTALGAIQTEERSVAASALDAAITAGQFTANINQAIAMGGDSTNSATWFLFNLWITLKALGESDTDSAIQRFVAAGLKVPVEVNAGKWWSGGYVSWYAAMSGADVSSGTITAPMPEKVKNIGPNGYPVNSRTAQKNGYSQSFCLWGAQAKYKPVPSSCFGSGTGVLMGDGSVKSIEDVRVDDVVQSHLGPRKVVLIETPTRGERELWQLDDLKVMATAGHPFRAASVDGPNRLAVDGWALMDSAPTMTLDGVCRLVEGAAVMGRKGAETIAVVVNELKRLEPSGSNSERVYDLLLHRWAVDHPAYYVGGPETFLAVEAETADPLRDRPGTAAVLAAMEIALESSRRHLADPERDLPRTLRDLDLGAVERDARQAASRLVGGPQLRPRVPGPDYYMRDGTWCAHASYLELHLARSLGRWFRSTSAMAWLSPPAEAAPGDHIAVILHDLELLGEYPLQVGVSVALDLEVRGDAWKEPRIRSITFEPADSPRWHLHMDRVLDFGPLPVGSSGTLVGIIRVGHHVFGRFRSAADGDGLDGWIEDAFVFGPDGDVIGRIGISHCHLHPSDLVCESRPAEWWTDEHVMATAISLGRQVGHRLAARIEAHATTGPLGRSHEP